MADPVSDVIRRRMSERGVRRIYGDPGDGIDGLVGALDRASDRLDFVQVRHEEMAAFGLVTSTPLSGDPEERA